MAKMKKECPFCYGPLMRLGLAPGTLMGRFTCKRYCTDPKTGKAVDLAFDDKKGELIILGRPTQIVTPT